MEAKIGLDAVSLGCRIMGLCRSLQEDLPHAASGAASFAEGAINGLLNS